MTNQQREQKAHAKLMEAQTRLINAQAQELEQKNRATQEVRSNGS